MKLILCVLLITLVEKNHNCINTKNIKLDFYEYFSTITDSIIKLNNYTFNQINNVSSRIYVNKVNSPPPINIIKESLLYSKFNLEEHYNFSNKSIGIDYDIKCLLKNNRLFKNKCVTYNNYRRYKKGIKDNDSYIYMSNLITDGNNKYLLYLSAEIYGPQVYHSNIVIIFNDSGQIDKIAYTEYVH
jgi:hypothetical protein